MIEAKASYGAADTRYVSAFQPEAVPARLRLACALADAVWNPDPERMTVLDIGCGRGLTACILAAANPGWDVVGLDLQAAHIAEAREMAAEAELANVRFVEADLAALDEAAAARLLPDADLVICYGVWTWVPDSVREGILRLLRALLKPGGALLLAYNALPGFADSVVLQRLLQDAAAGFHGNTAERAAAALSAVAKLREAEARYLPAPPVLDRVAGAARNAPAYMAHEYFTGFWRPAFAADVAREMARARLDFACAARPAEAMPEIQLRPEQRAAIAAMPAWMDRELLLDMFLVRRFRRDVFIRGRRPGGRAVLAGMRFVLAAVPEACKLTLDTQCGQASLPEAAGRAVVAALAEGPRSLGELAALPGLGDLTEADLGLMLSETGVAQPLWREAPDPAAAAAARRCNAVVCRRLAREAAAVGSALGAVVPVLGGALPVSASDLAVITAMQEGIPADATALAARLVEPEEGEDARRRALEAIGSLLDAHLAAWRAMGLV